jgi:hypothetical protein
MLQNHENPFACGNIRVIPAESVAEASELTGASATAS